MRSNGGTLLVHGHTHQFGDVANPYDGVSANDFEFYAAHIDAKNSTASFFYHPYLGTDYLKDLIRGIKAQGYTFVSGDPTVAG